MQQLVPLKFKSEACEEWLRKLCEGYKIPFETVEDAMNRKYILVPPGSADSSKIHIGRGRLMECPSEALDQACHDHVYQLTGLDKAVEEGRRRGRLEFRQHRWFGMHDKSHWLTGIWETLLSAGRRGLPPAARRELEKLDQKRSMKFKLRVVK